jgi:CheY-like chemotaxis protein
MRAEGKALKILIAEDIPMNMLLAKMLVEKSMPGAHILEATDGYQTLEQIMLEKPDLILLDVQMPGLDGVVIAQNIRQNKDSQINSIPIVAITASSLKEEKKRCLTAGANAFLTKPLNQRELDKILHHYLSQNTANNFQAALPLKEQLHFELVNLENRIGGNTPLLQELLISSISEIDKHLLYLLNFESHNLENINKAARIIFEISVTMSLPRLRRIVAKIQRELQNGNQIEEPLVQDLKMEWNTLKNIFQKVLSAPLESIPF